MTVLDGPTPPKPLSPKARVEHVGKDADADTIDGLLARDGGLIIDGLVGPDLLAQLRSELDPFLDTGSVGDNDFSGYRTKRIGALIARSPACRELARHPVVNAACERLLSPYCQGYQLHFTKLSASARENRVRCFTETAESGVATSIARSKPNSARSGRSMISRTPMARHGSFRDLTTGPQTASRYRRRSLRRR
jgi:hypothetical protein